MDRLEGYGYTAKELESRQVYMDGYGLRIGLAVEPGTGVVTGIDCYLLAGGNVDCLLGTTAVYPEFDIGRKWVDGIGMDEMISVLSEPRKAVMRFGAMKTEKELGVLEG